jgi:hypothetical protein
MNPRFRPAVSEPIYLVISREQVNECDISGPLRVLRQLQGNPEKAVAACGRISLVIDGYNNDPRELFEIPEVRRFIKELDAMWPYWFFFLSQADDSIKVIESCLCDSIEVVPGVTSIDSEGTPALPESTLLGNEQLLRVTQSAGEQDPGNIRGDHQPDRQRRGRTHRGGRLPVAVLRWAMFIADLDAVLKVHTQ